MSFRHNEVKDIIIVLVSLFLAIIVSCVLPFYLIALIFQNVILNCK